MAPANSKFVTHPYRNESIGVFDDPRAGLVREAFVAGADLIIDRLVEDIPDATSGFVLPFSASPFPGYQAHLEWRREDFGGNWYFCPRCGIEGWLCPALFKYLQAAPKQIFVQCQPRTASPVPEGGSAHDRPQAGSRG